MKNSTLLTSPNIIDTFETISIDGHIITSHFTSKANSDALDTIKNILFHQNNIPEKVREKLQ